MVVTFLIERGHRSGKAGGAAYSLWYQYSSSRQMKSLLRVCRDMIMTL